MGPSLGGDKLTVGEIDNVAYVTEKNKIEKKYRFD
ncbi:hypothetical protein LCGC14_0410820 [marine sediment metagenome]|uniref:Uncharacterized protein n=1 Tax=marine sediment metagenome TaxID=412755 RepID=A0A0F9VG26_9ZZZZ